MKLLGLDFETTGLDPEKDNVIEVGAVIWDTEIHQPLVIDNFFVNWGVPITEEVTKLNGVHDSYVEEYGLYQGAALDRLLRLMARVEAIVAHNGEVFDKPFYKDWYKRLCPGLEPREQLWIDTKNDLDYPEDLTTRKLTYLAAEHGFLNPFAHRAVFDVLTMMILLDKYNLESVLYSANQPTIMIQALVSFDDRQLAKDASFYWDPKKKMWLRSMKSHKYEPEKFNFNSRRVILT